MSLSIFVVIFLSLACVHCGTQTGRYTGDEEVVIEGPSASAELLVTGRIVPPSE